MFKPNFYRQPVCLKYRPAIANSDMYNFNCEFSAQQHRMETVIKCILPLLTTKCQLIAMS